MLRAVQKYCLSLYTEQINILIKNGCIENLNCGVMALKKDFYDCEGIGLNIKSNEPDAIFF